MSRSKTNQKSSKHVVDNGGGCSEISQKKVTGRPIVDKKVQEPIKGVVNIHKKKRPIKTLVKRTFAFDCSCLDKDVDLFEDDNIERGHIESIQCNHCKNHKKKKTHLHVKPQTQKAYSLLAVIPATLKVA